MGDSEKLIHPPCNDLPVDSGKQRQKPSEYDEVIIEEELLEGLPAGE